MKAMLWLFCVTQFAMSAAFAGVTDGQGHWNGNGVEFDAKGNALSALSLTMDSEAKGPHELYSTITIQENAKSYQVTQTLLDKGTNGFEIRSSQGEGGGLCFGEGLCEAYVGTQEEGFAINIVLDNSNQRRFLVTHLKNGEAVGFVRESVDREAK